MSEPVKPYYQEGSKKEQVGKMFDNIAPNYDLLNRLLSAGIDVYWRKKAIAKLKSKQPKVILDVATGTGDVAIEMVKQLKPDKIVGLDLANEMLEVGRKKIKKRELDQIIEMVQGDSENLPFQDNTFDAVTVAFGVRNFENLEQGLSEMHRVLKPGGQVVVLEFSKPKMPPFKQLYNFYFKNILPVVGRITSKDPKAYSYLYESVQAFPDGVRFEKILEKTGFKCTHTTALTLGICSIYYAEK
ncbi:MAG: bifunctional demethylmenaquinone methyltransferase/2-methoxy-6-polyprenyl-1,4-benzoquinol methylase UbiE [Saprospiraceae bacterium]|nr:bifunctional demethylmenaquinone methyltransferase/2-methoxy-6-polyprenyl-1,4-benzoquinol methylase UbiE [Saprospiraceae bacterium]